MQCKKCNAFIPEGYMYCPVCGEEIIIVSDFEIKLEDNIDTASIARTVELPDINETILNGKTQEIQVNKNHSNKKRINPRIVILIGIFAVLIISACIITGIKIAQYTSFDYQYTKGYTYAESGDYDLAIKTLKRAVTLSQEEKGRILLAECYMAKSNYDAAIAVLYDALNDFPDDVTLYDRIVKCYEIQGDSRGIHELIESRNDSTLALRYSDYVSIAPTFSLESGTYIEPDPIKLNAPGDGTIYYTTDGSEPTEESLQYMGPIALETGINTISAMYINEKNIKSEVVTKTYDVQLNIPDSPVLLVESGQLSSPSLIGVEKMDDLTIYYTTDGSNPDDTSQVYSRPFLMPLGKSSYCFIAYNENGFASSVTVGNYNLSISDKIDTKTAEYAISFQLLSRGENVLACTYNACYGYKDSSRTYYVIEELLGADKTGRYFAVDVSTGELFTFDINSFSVSPL